MERDLQALIVEYLAAKGAAGVEDAAAAADLVSRAFGVDSAARASAVATHKGLLQVLTAASGSKAGAAAAAAPSASSDEEIMGE